MHRRAGLGRSLAAAFVLLASTASANGRFPAASTLVARPGDPSRLLLRTTYGLLVSQDGGENWDWICERAIGYGGSEDPTVAIAGSGALVVGTFGGLARSPDGGCTWERDPKGPKAIIDIALRATAPDRLYAITSQYAATGDAGMSFHSELIVSSDAGEHWATRATLDPTLLLDSVEVAPSDSKRLYISAIRRLGRETRGVFLISNDDGAHFAERALEFESSDRGVYVAAVAPRRADQVYLRTSSVDASRLAVSDDAGETWAIAVRGGPLLGFALSENGDTIYTGGPKDGLLAAAATDLHFTPRSALAIQCLTSIGPALWACTPTSSGYVLGASTTGGGSFDPRLKLAGMRGPLRCKAPSAMDQCAADWSSLRGLIGFDDARDAAVEADAAPTSSRPTSACRCGSPGGDDANAAGLGAALLGPLAFLVRRRRRQVRQSLPRQPSMSCALDHRRRFHQ